MDETKHQIKCPGITNSPAVHTAIVSLEDGINEYTFARSYYRHQQWLLRLENEREESKNRAQGS